MNLHEYQAKQLFSAAGIPVPRGEMVSSPEQAVSAARDLGGDGWMLKAQVHAGGRGKGGGIRRADSEADVQQTASELLGSRLVTPQTGPAGLPVSALLVETPCDIANEFYVGLVVDRDREQVSIMVSSEGGMEIEEVAASHPDKIHTVSVDPVAGLQSSQCQQLSSELGLGGEAETAFSRIVELLYALFVEHDASLIEINPLVQTSEGEFMALDAKINLDENALFRHPVLQDMRDASQEHDQERIAREHHLNYVALDGNIACMVNGAGLAMATMDIIKLHGGEPANFLDVGGGTTADKVAEAFKLILGSDQVKAILVNIFGGIVRCDLIAEGIISAVNEVGVDLPVVVRLQGTNVDRGRQLLKDSGLSIITAEDLDDAARQAVEAAGL